VKALTSTPFSAATSFPAAASGQLRDRLPKVVALPGRGFVTFTIKAEHTAADHLLAARPGFAGIRCIFMQARAFLAGEGALAG
jgi:hypothetical protein